MDPATGAALVSAAGSFVTGLVNRWKDKRDQKDMLKYQNNMNLSNWSLQNQYNTPASQMQRLKDAGLNPNLIYQQGGATSQAGEIAAPSQTNFSEPLINSNPFDMYMDLLSNNIERGRLENETKAVQAQSDYQNAIKGLTERQIEILDKELGFKDRFLHQQALMNEYQMNVYHQTALHLQSQTGINQRDIDTYYMRLENTLANDRVQRLLGHAGIAKIRKEIDNINELMNKTKDERRLLQLEYVRGAIAKEIEEATANWQKSIDWSNFDDRTFGQSNLSRMLDQQMQLIEKEITGKTISNIKDPIRDILLPLSAAFLLRGKAPSVVKGFLK